MRSLLVPALLIAIGCSDPEPAPEPAPSTDATDETAPEPDPTASPTPRPSAKPADPAPRPTARPSKTAKPAPKAFVEPKPRPFGDGRPSWRQEPWWELKVTGSFPTVVYKVGELYGILPAARWGRPESVVPPRPYDAWLKHRCKRCSLDANPAGNPPAGGPTAAHEALDEELSEADQAKVEADFRAAAGGWPKRAKLDIAEDGYVTLTHSRAAHTKVQAWIRKRICPHRANKARKR